MTEPTLKQRLLGTGVEVGTGVGTDLLTAGLLNPVTLAKTGGLSGLAYAGINGFQGAYTNYLVQKNLYGAENVNWGEILSSGFLSAIPFMNLKAGKNVANIVGDANTVKRGIVGSAALGLGGEQIRVGFDEQRLLNPTEALLSAGVGGTLGGTFTQVSKKIGELKNPLKVYAASPDPTGATDDLMRQQAGLKMRLLHSIDPEDPTFYLGGSPGTKTINFKYKNRKSFDDKEVQDYVFDAWQHRSKRVAEGGKTQLMKGFNKILKNKSGQEYMLVRKLDTVLPRESPENYRLRLVKDVELDMIKKRGFEFGRTPKQQELRELQQSVNKFKEKHPDAYYAALMEYGDRAYLEHKIARGEHWFWSRVENPRKDDIEKGLFTWVTEETGAKKRNDPEQIRILFRDPFKELKDATETRLRRMNREFFKGNDVEKLVIDLEDPMSGDIFRRSNPGNLLIRKAGTGQKISVIPDFYEEIYSTAFKEAWLENPTALLDTRIPKKYRSIRVKDVKGKKKPVFDPNGRPETLDEYRARIFEEILDKALSGEADFYELTALIPDDLAEFYQIFNVFLKRNDGTPWLRKPAWTGSIIGEPISAEDIQAQAIQKDIRQQMLDSKIDELVSELGTPGTSRARKKELKAQIAQLESGVEQEQFDFESISKQEILKKRLEIEKLRREGKK